MCCTVNIRVANIAFPEGPLPLEKVSEPVTTALCHEQAAYDEQALRPPAPPAWYRMQVHLTKASLGFLPNKLPFMWEPFT